MILKKVSQNRRTSFFVIFLSQSGKKNSRRQNATSISIRQGIYILFFRAKYSIVPKIPKMYIYSNDLPYMDISWSRDYPISILMIDLDYFHPVDYFLKKVSKSVPVFLPFFISKTVKDRDNGFCESL